MTDTSLCLRIRRRISPVTVLGPGKRAGIWVQGCSRGCPGCIVPDSWPTDEGEVIPVADLADWVLQQDGIDGITLSGGEPMDQAAGLAEMVQMIRSKRDLGVLCYTGYQLERLGSSAHRALVDQVDLLIDGPYVQELHGDLLWRGSSNQRLHALTDRYKVEVTQRLSDVDRSAGLEFRFEEDGTPIFIGVPPAPDFAQTLAQRLGQKGILLERRVSS